MTHIRLVARPYDWALDEPSRSPVLDESQRRAYDQYGKSIVDGWEARGIPVVWHTDWTLERPPADLYVHDINMGSFRIEDGS